MNFSHKNFRLPTPKFWKRMGNSLLSVSTFVAGYSFYNSHEYIGITALVTGVVGRFLVEFFTEDNGNQDKPNQE